MLSLSLVSTIHGKYVRHMFQSVLFSWYDYLMNYLYILIRTRAQLRIVSLSCVVSVSNFLHYNHFNNSFTLIYPTQFFIQYPYFNLSNHPLKVFAYLNKIKHFFCRVKLWSSNKNTVDVKLQTEKKYRLDLMMSI